jgi:hypothetical protein
MTKDDFRNSTNISLGSNIPDAISTYVFDDSYGRELLDLYWREINTGNIYIALVSQKGKKPFLAQLPVPNQYKPQSNKLHNNKNVKMLQSSVNSSDSHHHSHSLESLSELGLPTYDSSNLHPEYTSTDELQLWGEVQQFLSSHGKTYTIETVIGCKGRDYKKGVAYLEYLTERYS